MKNIITINCRYSRSERSGRSIINFPPHKISLSFYERCEAWKLEKKFPYRKIINTSIKMSVSGNENLLKIPGTALT